MRACLMKRKIKIENDFEINCNNNFCLDLASVIYA